MPIAKFALGPLETNCYVVNNNEEAIVIDVGGDPAPIRQYLAERGLNLPERTDAAQLAALDTPEDMALLRKAAGMEDMIANAAQTLSVHHVSHYLMDLAGMLHSYYAKHQVLDAGDAGRSLARLALLRAVGQVLRNGLDILGVSAPETM